MKCAVLPGPGLTPTCTIFYTKKLAKVVALESPEIYCEIHGISKEDSQYALLMAWRVIKKLDEANHG